MSFHKKLKKNKHKQTKPLPISCVEGVFEFALIFYTVVLKWKFLSKKKPFKRKKKTGNCCENLTKPLIQISFLKVDVEKKKKYFMGK